ncbi:transcription initiation factor IIF, beta subunit [Schizopora paradoxa]|uniref:Transcription initiation factor IIF subunit beta n=1 Tax=Schizopora paradoxa TaxID=27342 RepID=A0A0H2SE08_9AGAM|nr:transcription initiation factor IIF, beta subunit [Schizopora paradoxa]
MEEDLLDEKKPYEEEHRDVKDEEELQPDPDETLMMEQSAGRVWSVKIPKHIMERWSATDEDDVQLGTIRVYDRDPKNKDRQRIMLIVPNPEDLTAPPEEYDLDMVNDAVENQVVIAEREKAPGSRARTTILTGRIKHDCNMRPLFSEEYRKRMRERTRVANTPQRTVKMMEDVTPAGRVNMLSSGVSTPAAAFSTMVKQKPKPQKGAFERYARVARNVLLDSLFALYREKPRWSAKDLRTRTEQPEAYLKEVLSDIADLHRSGEFNGLYELKPNFRDSVKSESGEYTGAAGELIKSEAFGAGGDVEMLDDDEDDDDDDEDDDMEEIS